jgi:hypothetical protein
MPQRHSLGGHFSSKLLRTHLPDRAKGIDFSTKTDRTSIKTDSIDDVRLFALWVVENFSVRGKKAHNGS